MTFTLVVTSHGRWEYLTRAIEALAQTAGINFFDRRILSLDGIEADAPQRSTWEPFTDLRVTGVTRQGLTANLTQAWGALTPEDEWVLHLEEDFVLEMAPLAEMAEALEANRDVAQMALVRQPWSPQEANGLLFGPHIDGQVVDEGGWLRQRRIFTLNPFVAHGSVLRSLTPGVENSLTEQCLARGMSFGFWGAVNDPPRCWHIGAEGGMGSEGWRA